MHVVRLLAPRLANEDHTKDVDFSPSGIRKRWEAGYADTLRAIERKAWQGEFDPLEGVILHEAAEDAATGRDPSRMAIPVEPPSRHKANGGLPHSLRGAPR
jgi:hypothetical protein